jgi:hypothetical protein
MLAATLPKPPLYAVLTAKIPGPRQVDFTKNLGFMKSCHELRICDVWFAIAMYSLLSLDIWGPALSQMFTRIGYGSWSLRLAPRELRRPTKYDRSRASASSYSRQRARPVLAVFESFAGFFPCLQSVVFFNASKFLSAAINIADSTMIGRNPNAFRTRSIRGEG